MKTLYDPKTSLPFSASKSLPLSSSNPSKKARENSRRNCRVWDKNISVSLQSNNNYILDVGE